MSCLSADFGFSFLIRLVLLCGLIAIIRIIVPWLLSLAGVAIPDVAMRVLNVVFVVMVVVICIYIAWVLWGCMGGVWIAPSRHG